MVNYSLSAVIEAEFRIVEITKKRVLLKAEGKDPRWFKEGDLVKVTADAYAFEGPR